MKIENHLIARDDVITMLTQKNSRKFGNGLPDSIIIHFTAGRSVESSAKYLAREDIKASAHIVLGRNGEIYQVVPFDTIAWHAGRSSYGGRGGYNSYSIGIEIDNAGPLEKVGNEYQAWFGKKYPESEVVFATHRNEKKPRYWHAYTQKQIDVCMEICEAIMENYNIREILGHEEISPGRKVDPGPAFPLDQFRNRLMSNDRSGDETTTDLPKKGTVNADFLNIRAGAGVANEKVAKPLLNGHEVEILEEMNGWYRVRTSIEGWVSKGFIKPEE